MTEYELRKKFVDTALSFMYCQKGGTSHKRIIDTYNSYLPHPRNYIVTYNDDWCATFVSAISLLCGFEDIIPIECSCSKQLELFKKLDSFVENDKYVPSIGDIIYYDWNDGVDYASTDNRGSPDHVGIVHSVTGTTIRIIEGNSGAYSKVLYRDISINGRYIRGFTTPKYSKFVSVENVCSVLLPVLSYGSKGNPVKSLQTLLNNKIGAKLIIDGSFGPATKKAVLNFQYKEKIEQDGVVGSNTWKKFFKN